MTQKTSAGNKVLSNIENQALTTTKMHTCVQRIGHRCAFHRTPVCIFARTGRHFCPHKNLFLAPLTQPEKDTPEKVSATV